MHLMLSLIIYLIKMHTVADTLIFLTRLMISDLCIKCVANFKKIHLKLVYCSDLSVL